MGTHYGCTIIISLLCSWANTTPKWLQFQTIWLATRWLGIRQTTLNKEWLIGSMVWIGLDEHRNEIPHLRLESFMSSLQYSIRIELRSEIRTSVVDAIIYLLLHTAPSSYIQPPHLTYSPLILHTAPSSSTRFIFLLTVNALLPHPVMALWSRAIFSSEIRSANISEGRLFLIKLNETFRLFSEVRPFRNAKNKCSQSYLSSISFMFPCRFCSLKGLCHGWG